MGDDNDSVSAAIAKEALKVLPEKDKQLAGRSFGGALANLGAAAQDVTLWIRLAAAIPRGAIQLITRTAHQWRRLPPHRRVVPAPNLLLGAATGYATTTEDELRSLFANLLATAIDNGTAPAVHPSFVDVIKQLTPDEARLLAVLKHEGVFFYDIHAVSRGPIAGIPTGTSTIGLTDLFERAGCLDRARFEVAISNLQRQELAIFEHTGTAVFTSGLPGFLEAHRDRTTAQGHLPNFQARLFRLTAYGRSFCQCCISDTTSARA